MNRKRIKKIERQINKLHGPRYSVSLPSLEDWKNPEPLTAEVIEEELKKLEEGTILYWAGVGSFFKYGRDDEAVITLSRSHLAEDYLEKTKPEGGEEKWRKH